MRWLCEDEFEELLGWGVLLVRISCLYSDAAAYLNLAFVNVLVNVYFVTWALLAEALDFGVVEEGIGAFPVSAECICALTERLSPGRGFMGCV